MSFGSLLNAETVAQRAFHLQQFIRTLIKLTACAKPKSMGELAGFRPGCVGDFPHRCRSYSTGMPEMATEVRRSLLTLGNTKVGASIHLWGIPAVSTCPGRTSVCSACCYANSGRYLFPSVQERHRWNLEQAMRDDFVERMTKEIRRKGCLVVRVHSSGDFMDASYAQKWLEIMRKCPNPRYYWYSRSWRCSDIAPVLEQMAALRCCRAWYSVDSETGLPEVIPPGVRLAYLQTAEDEEPELYDLLFRTRNLRATPKRLSLPMICPAETPEGKSRDVNCGSCQRCWRA